MKESTRLLKKYKLDQEWFREEIRSGYAVESWRKKLWLVELDLAMELKRVCRAHGLGFFLVGGSMIGAVRHQGFIPWDDDMDIAMFRADYEILLAHPEWFEAPYFLQTPDTDKGYFYSYAKLRNSRTTACTPSFAYQPMNHGMMIDIFPLDPWVPEEGLPLYEKVMELNRDNSSYMRRSNPHMTEAEQKRAEAWSGRDPYENYQEIQRLARSFEGRETDFISHAVITVDAYHSNYFPKEDVAERIEVPFEGFRLPIPKGYHDFLTREYGDYMQLPPLEKRDSGHQEFIFDPDKPYATLLPNP